MLPLRFPIRQVVVCVACNCIYEIKKQPAKVSVQEAPSKMPNFLKKKSDGGLIHDGVHSVAAGSVRMVARPVRLMLFSGFSAQMAVRKYHRAFGLIGTALSKNIGIF
jgi:hypothetical protein